MDESVYAHGYPPGQPAAKLTDLVLAVCPAHGVSIGRWDDRATWRLDAKPEAAPAEIAAAEAVLAAFDPWAVDGLELGADLLAAEAEAGQGEGHVERDPVPAETQGDMEPGESGASESSGAEGSAERGDAEGVDEGEGSAWEQDAGQPADDDGGTYGAIDADFTDADGLDVLESDTELADAAADFIAIEGQPDDIAVEEPVAADPGGVAYFGDNIHTIKLAKLGRLLEIAQQREYTALGDWTLAELQNQQAQLNRFVRGELGAGPEAQAHFDLVAERVREVEAIRACLSSLSMQLQSASRPGIEAFDPEAGWP